MIEFQPNGFLRKVGRAALFSLPGLTVPNAIEAFFPLAATEEEISSPDSTRWVLRWQDGKPFADQSVLKAGVGRPNAVLEIHLLQQRDGENGWTLLRKAAFSTISGDFSKSLARARQRAALLAQQAMIDYRNGVGPPSHDAALTQPFAATHEVDDNSENQFLSHSRALLQRVRTILCEEHWMLGIVNSPIEKALEWSVCPPVQWAGGSCTATLPR